MTRSRDLDFGLTNLNPAKRPGARHDLTRGRTKGIKKLDTFGVHAVGTSKTKQKMTRKPSYSVVTPKAQSAGRKKVVELSCSDKHLGDHPGVKKEQKGSQSVAMSQRPHGALDGSQAILCSPTPKSPSSTSCWKEQRRPRGYANDP